MTHGDDYKIRCPYCRAVHAVAQYTANLRPGDIREFSRPCPVCKRMVYYWARWAVAVDAEKEGKAR